MARKADICITISGPQGTGKTLIAGAIDELLTRCGAEVYGEEGAPIVNEERLKSQLASFKKKRRVMILTTNLKVLISKGGED